MEIIRMIPGKCPRCDRSTWPWAHSVTSRDWTSYYCRGCGESVYVQTWAEKYDIKPGVVLHGHLDGWASRDHYECVIVETVGRDWVVARSPDPISGAGVVFISSDGRDEQMFESLASNRDNYRGETHSHWCETRTRQET